MPRLRSLSVGLALLGVLSTAPLDATTIALVDLPQLVSGARAILHGRVIHTRAQLTGDRSGIVTLVTISADEYYKGDLGSEVVVLVPGGALGRYRDLIIGAPVFTAGDEVVLFLTSRGPSLPYVLGLSQGVFRVAIDARTGRKSVRSSPFITAGTKPVRIVRGDPLRQSMFLSEFISEVRSIVERSPDMWRRPPPGGAR